MIKRAVLRSGVFLVFLILAGTLYVNPAEATTYYVSPDGDNSNPGTQDAP